MNYHKLNLRLLLLTAVLAAIVFIPMSCRQSNGEFQDESDYYTFLSDSIQAVSTYDPAANFPFIDSLEQNDCIPMAVADYFRANTYYALNHLRAVEFYYRKALDDDRLLYKWPKAYYIASRNLANNLRRKNDQEAALSYATKAYERTLSDPSPEAQLNAPGLLLFIALCQHDLGQTEESQNNLEQSYLMSREQVRKDTSFNAQYHFAMNTLSTILTFTSNTPKEQIDLWEKRARESVKMLCPANDADRKLTETTAAIMSITTARILMQRGETEKADSAYQQFMNTDYAYTGGGIIYQYRYLLTAGRWDAAAALIPKVDSIRNKVVELKMTMESLKNMKEEYEALIHAGMEQEAQKRVVQVMQNIDSVARQQQLSTANELSVIFETQRKERKIAEQQSQMTLLWLLSGGAIVIVIVLASAYLGYYQRKEDHKREREHRRLQKAYRKLIIANERAEESSRMKSAFIKQISHEIRTPLHILSGFTQLITADDCDMDEKARMDARREIVENTDRIANMVNKMLELSEASSATNIVRSDEVTIGTLIDKAVEKSGIKNAKGIVFFLSYDSPITPQTKIFTKERQAVSALTHLLDNARKFTNDGIVKLTATQRGLMIYFIVDDTGIGVPPYESEHIFEEFVQLDEFKEGTGIGLTVARTFVRNLGGDIELDTTYSPGARFVMSLPAKPQDT